MKLRQGVFLDIATVDNGDLRLDTLDRCMPSWQIHQHTRSDEVMDRVQGMDLVVTNKVPLDASTLRAATHLKLIVKEGTIYKNEV